jgi:uncharacterized protein (DUF302 family)
VDYALKRTAREPFGVVTEAVERSIEAHGFLVVGEHDVHATLARKGFRIHPVRIYEVRDSSTRETPAGSIVPDRLRAGIIPGRISVFLEGDEVAVAAVRPSVVSEMFPEVGLEDVASEMEQRLIAVVDDAVDGLAGSAERD